ncbi:unnamed protein product [Schistosoma rodhaini]|nr:unnamed protein product [Schistosoma rodhaini]
MFWESVFAYSEINDLLSRPDLTIKELLDADDVLQKCREKDPRLINFLSRPDNLDYLIDLVSRTPESFVFNQDLYRYTSLACEILTNDINEILDGIIELTESTIDQPTPNELHNNACNNNNNNHILESNQINCLSLPSSFSSPLPSSSMIINDHNLKVINNKDDQSCNNILIVNNNSHTDPYSNVHDNDAAAADTNHLSSPISVINESSIINDHNSQLFNNIDHNNLNELLTSNLKLSSPMLLPTSSSSTITTSNDDDLIKVNNTSTTTRRRIDLLLHFFHYSNQPVNPLSASFVSRLLIHLTLHRGNIIIPYLRSSKGFLDQLFLSLDSSAVADLIIQLSQQETKQQHIIFEWFKTDRLVERLIEKFDPTYSSDAHESAAHCLIELITVLRNYLVNNPPNLDTSDTLMNSMTTTTFTANNIGSSMMSGSPLNSLFDKDEETYKAAENLLNVLESEETMSMLLNRITANEYVEPSILVSCVNVCMALIGKKKPESSFPVGEDGYSGLDFDSLIKFSGDISNNLKSILRNNSNPSNDLNSGNHCPTTDNHTSDTVGKSDPFVTASKDDNNNNNTVIDKLHIMKASENLIKTSLPYLDKLHDLLKRFHPQFYNCMPTTHCTLNPPLGRCRLAILQLIASLISLPISTNLSKTIVDIGFVKTSMELFALYPYNTFLHHYVTDIIKSIFKHSGLVNSNNNNNGNNSTNVSDKTTTNLINTTTTTNSTNTTTASTNTVKLSSNHDDNQLTESLSSSILSAASAADSSTNPFTTEPVNSNVIHSTNSSSTNELDSHDHCIPSHNNTINNPFYSMNQNYNEFSKNILINLIKDHHLIDWCLKLSPLPSLDERPNDGDSPNCLVRLSKDPVKSGYSGHIWQIGNLIVSAMNGPYGEFLKSLIQDLDPKTQNLWSDFVKDLNVINSVEVAETSQSAIEGLNHSDVPFVLAPVTSSNLMQNKLLDLNGKSSSYLFDDVDNNEHEEYGKTNHEYLAYHPVISASTLVNLQRQSILQNFMDSWLDPDEESEHNDNVNSNSIYDQNNNPSEEKDQFKPSDDIHIGVPGPLGEMYFNHNSDSDGDYFNGDNNEDDDKDENDELDKSKDNIHSRGYCNSDEDDDDEEDLKSPVQIKQQHSSKQSISNANSSTSVVYNHSNEFTEVSSVTTHNNESSIKINSNGNNLSQVSTTIPTTATHTTNSTISLFTENIEMKLFNGNEEMEQTKHNTSSESIVTLLNANFIKK